MDKSSHWQQKLQHLLPRLKPHTLNSPVKFEVPTSCRFLLLLSGRVHVYAYHDSVEEPFLIGAFIPGQWVSNEYGAITQLMLHASCNATMLPLSVRDVDAIEKADTSLVLDIHREASKQHQIILQRLCCSKLNAYDRVQELLSSLFVDHSSINHSHSELAMMVGLSRETVSRSLYQIEKQGLICMEKRNITSLESY
ncbi:MAG: Crp/Fnr family transcriptional regulator [Pseudomonadota bacterium]